jgi:soluble lytic murein transglycosylase-like protein
VCRYAKLYDRDVDLVLAIINHESDFNPKAKSKIGYPARGLMQIMPHWKKVYDIKGSLEDPETSIRYGLLILGAYEEMYHDLETAIIVYNRGPSPVDWDLIKGRNPANNYLRKIMKTYDTLQELRVD